MDVNVGQGTKSINITVYPTLSECLLRGFAYTIGVASGIGALYWIIVFLKCVQQ